MSKDTVCQFCHDEFPSSLGMAMHEVRCTEGPGFKKATHTPVPSVAKLTIVRDPDVEGYAAVIDEDVLKSYEGKPGYPNFDSYFACGLTDENARLVAAAPEMLEALKGVALWLEEYRGHMGVPQLQALKAAIAKAEGRS